MSEDEAINKIAQWMKQRVESSQILLQRHAVFEIQKQFGDAYVYRNKNGNLAILKEVLTAFSDLTSESVVWSRSRFAWRLRRESDPIGVREVKR